MVMVGSSVYERVDSNDINKLLLQLTKLGGFVNPEKKWNGFNILHKVIIYKR